MCKFDKNQSYSTRTVFEALNNKFPEEKEETLFPLIGQRFTALKLVPVNKQKKNRFFSGKDCQTVFDYYDKKFCKKYGLPYKKEKDKQVTVFEVLKPKKEKGLSVTITNKTVIEEIEKRCQERGITRVKCVTDILSLALEHPTCEETNFAEMPLDIKANLENIERIKEVWEKEPPVVILDYPVSSRHVPEYEAMVELTKAITRFGEDLKEALMKAFYPEGKEES